MRTCCRHNVADWIVCTLDTIQHRIREKPLSDRLCDSHERRIWRGCPTDASIERGLNEAAAGRTTIRTDFLEDD